MVTSGNLQTPRFETDEIPVGILTMRSAAGQWFFLNLQYEFEDAIAEVFGAPLLHIEDLQKQGTRRNLLGRTTSEFPVRIGTLFVVAMTPERVWLDRLKNWRKMCDRVCVYLFDAWPTEKLTEEIRASSLNNVDVIFASFPEGAEFLRGRVKPQVEYLPQGFHGPWFKPGPLHPSIYCSAMARQDEGFLKDAMIWCARHDRLLIRSTEYGTFRRNWIDTQQQYAEIVRHSRVSLCWSNRTRPDWASTCRIDPVTTRHLHILGSGALYAGTPPGSSVWREWFPDQPCIDASRFKGHAGALFEYVDAHYDGLKEKARSISERLHAGHTWHHRAREIAKWTGLDVHD